MHTTPGDDNLRAALAGLPKIDLHRHLEGSLRLASLQEIALACGLDLPARSLDELRPYVQVTDDEPNFRNFLEKFTVLRRFYRSPEIIRRLAYEVVEDAVRDNVRYLELRFTPAALASTQGYALEDVTEWVLEAVAAAQRAYPQVRVGLIASVNRHETLEIAERVTRLAIARSDRGIVGLDLAGDEVNYAAGPFRRLFGAAREAGLGVVAHAGEWTGAETVRDALENLGVTRIGHGVRVVEDPDVAALARERGVVFEVCVTSNLQSGVIRRLADHPLRDMAYLNLKTTINTDDPAVSNITLTDEYATVISQLGFTADDVKRCILTAAAAAFLPPAERTALVEAFRQALGAPAASGSSPTPPRPRG